jgi:hypothetical protein
MAGGRLVHHGIRSILPTFLRLDAQGAKKSAVDQYHTMINDPAAEKPLAWSDPTFNMINYDLVYFPGGHEKSVRQIMDSATLQKHIAEYFPQTRKPSHKTVAAICHGVQVLSAATLSDGKSVLHDVTTTALPGAMESSIYWLTCSFLGDYYKTYGKGTDNVETVVRTCFLLCCHALISYKLLTDIRQVRKTLDDPEKQYKNSLGMKP